MNYVIWGGLLMLSAGAFCYALYIEKETMRRLKLFGVSAIFSVIASFINEMLLTA